MHEALEYADDAGAEARRMGTRDFFAPNGRFKENEGKPNDRRKNR